MAMRFFMPMEPPTVTHQTKKVRCVKGKPMHYEDARLKDARAKLMSALWPHAPEEPIGGAVQLMTKWCFGIRGKHVDGEYKTSRPDTDNLQKLLKDCMTDCGYWVDDAQVASEIVQKFWAEVPGIEVYVEEIVAEGRA